MDQIIEEQTKIKSESTKKFLFLSERDITLLNFVFQMKFCTSQHIMGSVYFNRLDGVGRASDLYIKRRLAQLVAAGWLSTDMPNFGNRYYIYRITNQTLKLLDAKGENVLVERVPRVNFQNMEHDSYVTNCRNILEKNGLAFSWVPDFQIKKMFNSFQGLPDRYIPDGLFINKLGELTALEMEISRKSLPRYQDKVDQYVKLANSQFEEELPLKRVLYVTKTPGIQKILTGMTKINPNIFRVETYSSLLERT